MSDWRSIFAQARLILPVLLQRNGKGPNGKQGERNNGTISFEKAHGVGSERLP
jgi:hypothetical protein